MKGLLIKDIKLLNNQKKQFILLLVMFVFLGFTGIFMPEFIMGYPPFTLGIFVMSTISYDDFDNGLSFLMTLPVTRNMYVAEKYVLALVMIIAGSICSFLIALLMVCKQSGAKEMTLWLADSGYILGAIVFCIGIFMGIMIPVQLKFGAEKGRIVLFIVFMILFGVFYFGEKLIKMIDRANVMSLLSKIEQTPGWLVAIIMLAVAIILLLISYRISVCIMKKKEL